MKERPIIMGAESVRAILDGRKTMTRRVVKPQPEMIIDAEPEGYSMVPSQDGINEIHKSKCPYGQVGDRLWVKESWKPGAWRNDGRVAIDYMASPELTHTPWAYMGEQASRFIHKWLAEVEKSGLVPNEQGRYEWEPGKSPLKWKSPMYMPRLASRMTLEVADIRVERLHDITPEDALKEGFCNYGTEVDTLDAFCEAWQKINAKRGYPWESNPWVWVISFKRVSE